MATLKLGDRGHTVEVLQTLLNSLVLPSPSLRADGNFGPRTRDAVLRFQRTRGLKQDGVVGPNTWTALGQRLSVPPPALTNLPRTSWMQIAEAELGIHEDALPGKHSQRIIEYHQTTTLRATMDETPWCSSFVNWVMTKAGYAGTNSAAAKSWLDWGSALSAPREGAIIVIKRKTTGPDAATGSSSGFHVAFHISSTPTHVRLLGGNQGDQVRYSNFSLATYELKAHRWPS